jgi:signal transduction histidine kinase
MEYSNKLASIGRLAAGVAHEINNPLAIINEKAGLIKDIFTYTEKYTDDTKIIGLIDSVLSSVERCGTITKRMLSFARHMDVKIERIKLAAVIEDVLGFLGKEAEYRSIDVTVNIAPDIPDFQSDRGKLQQIFLNIINNAFAAMEDGGQLEIIIKYIDRNGVEITIADNGCGMSETDLKRIFEPFFSTKTKVGGTGLGLSITYGLVQELGGTIYANSQEGLGTTFTIKLPLTPPQTLRRKKNANIISG